MMKLYQDKLWLYQKYLTEELSTSQIGKLCGMNNGTIWYWLNKHGIKIRSIAEAQTGARHPMFGKHIPNERKKRQSLTLTGRIRSEDHCKNLSISCKGNKNRLGHTNSDEHNEKIRNAHLGSQNPMFGVTGESHPKWKGGVAPRNHLIRTSSKYKEWRLAVFERDNYTCQNCRAHSGNGKAVYLHAHHIYPFAKYPEKRFDVNNGLTLCIDCHFGRIPGMEAWL